MGPYLSHGGQGVDKAYRPKPTASSGNSRHLAILKMTRRQAAKCSGKTVIPLRAVQLVGLLTLVLSALHPQSASSYSTSNSNHGNSNSKSPWAPAEWRINLDIGRSKQDVVAHQQKATATADLSSGSSSTNAFDCSPRDPNWGISGARLCFPLEVRIESDRFSSATDNDKKDTSGYFQLTVLEDPTFISSLQSGEQEIVMGDVGAWKIGARIGIAGGPKAVGDASELNFWIDLGEQQPSERPTASSSSKSRGASGPRTPQSPGIVRRNDVTLASNERLYFTANCWREPDIELGQRRFLPLQQSLQQAQAALDEQLSHQDGDRRLDGTNPIDTAMATIDMALLVKARDECLQKVKEAERRYPVPYLKLSAPGAWPGTTDRLVVAPGTIGVKRKSGILFGAEELYTIGTWTATPLEGLSEYIDEEEDQEEEKGDNAV